MQISFFANQKLREVFWGLCVLGIAALQVSAQSDAPAQNFTLDLQPVMTLPGTDTTTPGSDLVAGRRVERWSNLASAMVTWYPAPGRAGAVTPAILVFPGGGYRVLATDIEGTEVCAWLNRQGISALLLRYRVPTEPPHAGPLSDAQSALSSLITHAAEWHVDQSHIGVIGFSAGAHLAGRLAAGARPGTLGALLLIYPAYYSGSGEDVAGVRFPSSTPPTFLIQTEDDPVGVSNALSVFTQLSAEKVPAELHVYSAGGHGYGLRSTSSAVLRWPTLAASWLQRKGFTQEGETKRCE